MKYEAPFGYHSNYLSILNTHFKLPENAAAVVQHSDTISSGTEFEFALKKANQLSQILEFTSFDIAHKTINWPQSKGPINFMIHGAYTAKKSFAHCMLQGHLRFSSQLAVSYNDCTFTGKLTYNNFVCSKFSNTTFEKSLHDVNFKDGYSQNAIFKDYLKNINFACHTLDHVTFEKPVAGFSSFNGCELKDVTFKEPCGKLVLFIGAVGNHDHIKGGIHSVQQLKDMLTHNEISKEEARTLKAVLQDNLNDIHSALGTRMSQYMNLNTMHADFIHQSIHLISSFIEQNPGVEYGSNLII